MDDLFDNAAPLPTQSPAAEPPPAADRVSCAPAETISSDTPSPAVSAEPETAALPSQSGAPGTVRELRSMAAQPLPPLSRENCPIVSDAFGSTLRALREQNRISIEVLSQRTQISTAYIKALEEEDYKHLPPPVYVSAYIRRLGSLYGLTAEELSGLTAKVRAMMAYELPCEPDQTTITYEDDEENDERIRRMLWGAAIGIAVLAAVAISGIILWAAHPAHKGPGELPVVRDGAAVFRMSDLIARRLPLQLKPGCLPVPGAGR